MPLGGLLSPRNNETSFREKNLAAVVQQGLTLEFATEELRAGRRIVLAAMTQHGTALQFAANLQRDNDSSGPIWGKYRIDISSVMTGKGHDTCTISTNQSRMFHLSLTFAPFCIPQITFSKNFNGQLEPRRLLKKLAECFPNFRKTILQNLEVPDFQFEGGCIFWF